MALNIFILLFLIILHSELPCSSAQTWINVGYWFWNSGLSIEDINSPLFTHLVCSFADINSSTYQLSLPSDEQLFSTFTAIVKQKNPSIITLLSIGGDNTSYTAFSLMVSQSSYRKSFIDSSIEAARLYGFHGLDFAWHTQTTVSDMTNTGALFEEWRAAANSELRNSSQSQLILTMAAYYLPNLDSISFPIESMQRNLDWVHVLSYGYSNPSRDKFTRAHAALYNPLNQLNTDFGISEWISRGIPASKLVLGLPFYGYAWTLDNPEDNVVGSPAKGSALPAEDGAIAYKDVRGYMQRNGVISMYNATYVVNYCTFESTWIGFDDVEAVTTKVSYAKEMKMLGYHIWQISQDDNWVLSQSAQDVKDRGTGKNRQLLIIILLPIAIVGLLLCSLICYLKRSRRLIKSKGKMNEDKETQFKKTRDIESAENLNNNDPNLQIFSFVNIEMATNNFSIENKLGEGGFGPVYKGELQNGEEIAVKRLSKSSKQGLEEFKNEVTLTAKLQHVNLVRVLGFCTEREEKMLIYEYMPNKSLDHYLFDPVQRLLLDWRKRVQITEGVTQGLLYLQEYSRLTILHRDLKASNILLDQEMKPKISDFGLAKVFERYEHETNTSRIVGTYGYLPPECIKDGIYSMKSDVYSFGVLLLQIISGKKNTYLYGLFEDLNLLDYAYELWKEGKEMEFMDPSLDDTSSSCKLMKCMQVGLLCVQEKPDDRPSMLEVSSMLKNETAIIATPKKPAFSRKRYGDEENKTTLHQETCSVNYVTITEMVPRK